MILCADLPRYREAAFKKTSRFKGGKKFQVNINKIYSDSMYKSNIFLQNFSPFTGLVLTVFYACDIITLIGNELFPTSFYGGGFIVF